MGLPMKLAALRSFSQGKCRESSRAGRSWTASESVLLVDLFVQGIISRLGNIFGQVRVVQ